MSYKLCFLAVPVESSTTAFRALSEMGCEIESENGYRVSLATSSDADAAATGLRMMHVVADPAPDGRRVSRGFFTDRWEGPGPLFVAVYDDQNGFFVWERLDADRNSQAIATSGHRVGVRGIEITVDYAQKGFTNAELDAAFRRDPATLTPREARALMEPTDAITIGLAQFGYGGANRYQFLDLLTARTGWSLTDIPPERGAIPESAGPVIDYYLEPYQQTSFGFAAREY